MQNSADNQQLYSHTGKENNQYSVRNSTILFETQNPNEYRNTEVKFTALLNSKYAGRPENEISVRWSVAPHYGDNIVKCFDVGFGITTGKTRIRYEHQHPEYTDVLAIGSVKGEPLSHDLPVELKFVKLDNSDNSSTLFKVWQKIDESGWTELFSYNDTEHHISEYPIGCQIAIKARDYTDIVIIKNIKVSEIEGLPDTHPAE